MDMINDLPIRLEDGLLSYNVLKTSKLTTTDIENLYRRLTHSTLTEDINNGIVEDIPDETTIGRRLKHLKFSINQADVSKIEDIDLAFGDNIPTTKILSEIMDYAEAYDYINTVWAIFREWNLIVDCLNKVVSEIESEFLTPQPDTSTKQEKTVIGSPILDNIEIVEVFDKLIKNGYVEPVGDRYRWLKDNALLAYLCERISTIFELSEKRGDDDKEFTNWRVFNGLFIVKGQNGDIVADSRKLNRYRTDWLKNHRPDGFSPRGYEDIESLLYDYK